MGKSSEVPSPGYRPATAACSRLPQQDQTEPAGEVEGLHIRLEAGERHTVPAEAVQVDRPKDLSVWIQCVKSKSLRLLCIVEGIGLRLHQRVSTSEHEHKTGPGCRVGHIAVEVVVHMVTEAAPTGLGVEIEAAAPVHTELEKDKVTGVVVVPAAVEVVDYNLAALVDKATMRRNLEVVGKVTVVLPESQAVVA